MDIAYIKVEMGEEYLKGQSGFNNHLLSYRFLIPQSPGLGVHRTLLTLRSSIYFRSGQSEPCSKLSCQICSFTLFAVAVNILARFTATLTFGSSNRSRDIQLPASFLLAGWLGLMMWNVGYFRTSFLASTTASCYPPSSPSSPSAIPNSPLPPPPNSP
ncbi:hypothetical protein BC829DRAFT_67190 [Chytridium lagenaria]|nr:hypothetical protein BC829DRAFT_67190 [Chytridium lagenaria]